MQLSKNIVTVINLGRMGFLAASDLQTRYARQHLDSLAGKVGIDAKNIILLVQHHPVYTTGFRSEGYTEKDAAHLKSLGASFYRTNRGGLITFHGPGQLVAYPIINLIHFKPSMKWYVGTLERTMIETCAKFGIKARTTNDTGIWVEDRKIGAIGVHGSRYITTHGVSLNANVDLEWYKHIDPCGLKGKEVTTLTKELGRCVSVNDVIAPFLEAFEKEFNCEVESSLLEDHEHIFIPHRELHPDVSVGQNVQAKRMLSTMTQQNERRPMW